MKIKVIAHTKMPGGFYDWSVIVEMDRDTIGKLINEMSPDCPVVGQEYDLSPIISRLHQLESRERNFQQLAMLLKEITRQQNAEEEKG